MEKDEWKSLKPKAGAEDGEKGCKAEAGEVEVRTEEVFNQSSLTLCFRIWQ